MDDLDALIKAERLKMIDFLAGLDEGEWSVQSLCEAWTVQDVAAHLAWSPAFRAGQVALGVLRAGFRVNKFNAEIPQRWARRGQQAILEQLRDNAATDRRPPWLPRIAELTDTVCHSLDIRLPLGKPEPLDPAVFAPVATFLTTVRGPLGLTTGGRSAHRVRGLRLVASDLDWSRGEGADTVGSSTALLLMLTGRATPPDSFSGPGAPLLQARLKPVSNGG